MIRVLPVLLAFTLSVMFITPIISWSPYNGMYKTNYNGTFDNKCSNQVKIIDQPESSNIIYCDCFYRSCSFNK